MVMSMCAAASSLNKCAPTQSFLILLAIMTVAVSLPDECIAREDTNEERTTINWSSTDFVRDFFDGRSVAFGTSSLRTKQDNYILSSTRQRNRRLQQSADSDLNAINPQPIRFETDFQISSLTAEEQTYIRSIVNAAEERLVELISVKRPVNGNLLLSPRCTRAWRWQQSGLEECGSYADDKDCFEAKHREQYFGDKVVCSGAVPNDCFTLPGGEGASDADFILYVTAVDTDNCIPSIDQDNVILEDKLAQGGFCAVEDGTGRPVAGAINFCPDAIDISENRPDVDVAIHEIMHGLLFSKELYSLFIDENNNVLGYDNVVQTVDGLSYIITPQVVEKARLQSNCDEIIGARLENDGSVGTETVHWDTRHYMGEIMVGTAPATDTSSAISNLTLALFEDSGWYKAHYCKADLLMWELQTGCDAYFAACDSRPLPPSLESSFCAKNGETGCVYDFSSVGVCSSMSLNPGCEVVQPYSNLQCTVDNFGGDQVTNKENADSPLFWGQAFGNESRCIPMIEGDAQRRLIRDGLQLTTYSRSNLGGGCFVSECEYENGEPKLYIKVFDKRMRCQDGQMINLSGTKGFMPGSAIGPCPSAALLCASLDGVIPAKSAVKSSDSGSDDSTDSSGDRETTSAETDDDSDENNEDGGNFFTACFPGTSTVLREDGTRIQMRDLRIGDKVAVSDISRDGALSFEEVYTFTHFDQTATSSFVEIETKHNCYNNRTIDNLIISADHMLPALRVEKNFEMGNAGGIIACEEIKCLLQHTQLIRAVDVRVGDFLVKNVDEIDQERRWGELKMAEVTNVRSRRQRGLFHPHTTSGRILVDDILCSCYTSLVSERIGNILLQPVHIMRRLLLFIIGKNVV